MEEIFFSFCSVLLMWLNILIDFFNIESLVFYENISLASEDFGYNARFDLSILTFNNVSLYP